MAKHSMEDEIEDEEFEDDDDIVSTPRWVGAIVLTTVLIAFMSLAWYAYHQGKRSVKEEDLVLIEADKQPVKEKPEEPGGMKFPHQDKTIFDAISNNSQKPAPVERVLPAPEEPMNADSASASGSETRTWINEKLQKGGADKDATKNKDKAPASELIEADKKQPEAPVQPAQEEVKKTDEFAAAPVAEVKPEVDKPLEKQDVKVVPVAEAKKPETQKPEVKAEVKPEPKPAAKAEAKTVTTVSSVGGKKGLIQLGAYKSEAEAKSEWARMQKKHAALSGATLSIQRADLGEKGIYYRLRAEVANAKALCASLSANGQACILAK